MQPGSKTSGVGDGETGRSERDSDSGLAPGSRKGRSRSRRNALAESRNWLSEPRTTVLVVLGAVVLLGGGRKLLQAWKARKAVARLSEPDITPREIESVAQFGRSGLPELFRTFGEPPSSSLRDAAGRPGDLRALGARSVNRRGRASAGAQRIYRGVDRKASLSQGAEGRNSHPGDVWAAVSAG